MSDDARDAVSGHGGAYLLFVAARTPSARRALRNLGQCLRDSGIGADTVEIVDVFRAPEQALAWGVFATPMLIRRSEPDQRLYGDLTATGTVARFLLGTK